MIQPIDKHTLSQTDVWQMIGNKCSLQSNDYNYYYTDADTYKNFITHSIFQFQLTSYLFEGNSIVSLQ